MKKVNKKLASAIVLGLMLAVPVGVSAAEVETVTIDTQGTALTQEEINELNGKNVVFTNSKESGQIFTSNKDAVEVKVDGVKTIQLDGAWSNNAFYASNGGILTINADKIETISDKNADCNLLQVWEGTMNVNVKDFIVKDVYTGLYAQRTGTNNGNSNLNFQGSNLDIEADSAIVAVDYLDYSDESNAEYQNNKINIDVFADEIRLVGTNGYGIRAHSTNTNYQWDDEKGEWIFEYNDKNASQTSVSVVADESIYLEGSKGAIYVVNGLEDKNSEAIVKAADITIKGDIYADTNAKVDIGGDYTYTDNNGTKHDIKFNKADIVGNVTAIDADVNLNLGTEGSFTGWIKTGGESIVGQAEQIALAAISETEETTGVTLNMGSGSTWTVTGDSSVSTVNGEGTIKIAEEDVKSVKVDSVGESSKLTIGNTANITDTFDGNNLAGSIAEYAGRFEIAGDKALTYVADSGSVIGETSAVIDANGNVTSVAEKANEFNAGISEMASIGLMAWRAENNDMNKRLGELRNSNGEHGVWARMVRGESEYGSQGIKNVYNTYQLGYDEKLSTNDHWTVGAAISYTDAQSSFATGSGENTSKGLSFYGSYLGDNGEFVDLIAKYARLDNEFDVAGGAGSGDYSTNGYSFSAEFGKRNQLANDFYFEPQVELTYGRVADADYVTSKQVKVSQDAMDSLVGRVGFAAGKNIKNGNVYVRASYLYDFDGETSVSFTNGTTRTFEEDLGGGWFEFGIGTNINLSDATYLYLDVEKTTGGEVDTNWQWNAGVRYSF